MKVVLLTYYFPPDQAVGALRPAKVHAAFERAGHEVHVVTARIRGGALPVDGSRVTRVRSIPHPREMWLLAKSLLHGSNTGVSGSADPGRTGGIAAVPDAPTWKRWLSSAMWLPDDRQGFILPAVAAALPLIREGADLVYTTAPPFSVHIAGLLLKQLTGVRWAAEFRDPWSDNPAKPAHVRSGMSDVLDRALEGRCLKSADHVIGVSRGIHHALAERARRVAPDGASKTILVRNGIDSLSSPAAAPATSGVPKTFRIIHVGTFYHARDPRPFLHALALARPSLNARHVNLHVDFVGDCRWFNDVAVDDLVRQLGLSDVVHFTDWVPHARSVAMVQEADLLLLLAQQQPAQVPNKVYEYLGSRRPVLAFVDDDGETAELLRAVGGHYLVTDNGVERTAAILSEAAVRGGAAPSDESELVALTTAAQMSRLVEALDA